MQVRETEPGQGRAGLQSVTATVDRIPAVDRVDSDRCRRLGAKFGLTRLHGRQAGQRHRDLGRVVILIKQFAGEIVGVCLHVKMAVTA